MTSSPATKRAKESGADAAVFAAAAEWLRLDRHEPTRKEVEELVARKDAKALHDILDSRMEFGTAGLRARMGAGFARMNMLTILQTSQGLAKYIVAQFPERAAAERSVVIGYDARHNSTDFALVTARAMLAEGIRVHLFDGIVPTPFVPFAVKRFGCCAGVMVTASHNPKEDNGYKVYWSNGAQIIPPHDAGIARAIEANVEPWAEAWETGGVRGHASVTDPMAEVHEHYFAELNAVCFHRADNSAVRTRFTYSAMHGVGHEFARKSFAAFGLPPFVPVAQQVHPDPDFPTVTFPNPEEGKSALNLSIETADAAGSTIILANDPDADRLAVAERLAADGSWHVFSGNELGTLFAWWLFAKWREAHPAADAGRCVMLASTVSSKMAGAMARKHGFQFEETLTGFKWMGNRAHDRLARADPDTVLFAFEQAIGFMCGTTVLDKDGVSAAGVFGEMTAWLERRGSTPYAQLYDLYAEYGYFCTNDSYFICHHAPTIQAMFDKIRHGGRYPAACGQYAIEHVRDLTTGYDSSQPDKKATLPTSASSQMITFTFANGCVATLRTSGTEPKIKYYTEMSGPASTQAERETVVAQLADMVRCIVEELFEPEKNGLIARTA